MAGFIIGTVFGAVLGVVCMALLSAASAADDGVQHRRKTE